VTELPGQDGVWPKSRLAGEEILRRLAIVGEGDPGHGYRLLMVQAERCSNCCKHRNLCGCWPSNNRGATAAGKESTDGDADQ